MTPQYQTTFDPSPKDLAPIDHGLHAFNVAHLGQDVIDDYTLVAILARDEEGVIIGGVHGELVWGWLYIKTLWVNPNYRHQGIGTRLLRLAEAAALSHGVSKSHLETTDFQALDFYLKNGYEIFGKLADKPAGSTWYYIKKNFSHPGQDETSNG